MKILLAGGTGAIGRALVPQLVDAGHEVVATTRHQSRQDLLHRLGATPLVMDGLVAESVGAAVAGARPDVIVHQMTAIETTTDLRHFDRTFAVTNRLRTEGTDSLLAAAQACGVRRMVAQSFAGWPYARSGAAVKSEDDPLDENPPARQRQTLAAIRHLERAVLRAPLESVVLRYGLFYGNGVAADAYDAIRARKFPSAGDGGGVWSWVHVDDAAAATVAAVERGTGIYNIVDDDPVRVADLLPEMARILDAKPPRRVPVWLARLAAGEVGVSMLTRVRGASNARAAAELDWHPRWSSWRDGMRAEVEAGLDRAGSRA